ncbi:hypothetical protein ACPYPG_34285 [Streptomyces sp. FR-108]|uniref:hypothetical protein n=1 Tax=Streptomyces sp. FR-108 TaxID=3416665 RepID=UPI003CE9D5DB
MKIKQARAAMSHRAFCDISAHHLGELIAELATRWNARCESARHERRHGARKRKADAGPKYKLIFTDRVLMTPVHLRNLLSLSVRTTPSARRSDSRGTVSPRARSSVIG